MKKEYEGKVKYMMQKTGVRECCYPKNCVWKVSYDESKDFKKINPAHPNIPYFRGYICNCPDFDRKTEDCPSRLSFAEIVEKGSEYWIKKIMERAKKEVKNE